MVLALKSGITFIRTRPEPLPRFSTATRTSAARRPLSAGSFRGDRLARRQPTFHQLLLRHAAAPELHSPWPGARRDEQCVRMLRWCRAAMDDHASWSLTR